MKKRKLLAAAMAGGLALMLAFTGCGKRPVSQSGSQPGNDPSQSVVEQGPIMEFVAADKTNWDKVVNIGSYSYTIKVTLDADGTLELAGTCVGKAQQAEQSGPNRGGGSDPSATPAEDVEEPDEAKMRSLDFKQTGTWTKEEGLGYTLVLADAVVTKTNYDKASARQYFYLPIYANDANAGLIQFQGKDVNFRKEMASDYERFEIRDAKYSFEANGSTATGNSSTTSVWLENDGSANCLVQSGSNPTYKHGFWEMDPETKNITVSLWGTDYYAIYCDVAGKEGYRLSYDGSLLYSNTEASYVDEDFDGKTVSTLQCYEGDYTLNLTEKGIAVLMQNGSRSKDGTYTGEGDSLVVVLDGTTYTAADGKLNISWTSGSGSSASTVERVFNTDGSKPDAPAATQGGEAQGGEPGSAEAGSGENAEGGEAPAGN
ncbi:MAG: hypothetical protein IJ773_12435 [Lachnospiraceae bacterium]|nr:hypothetical protein [Lachnospiraceae bacterium]